MIKRKIIIPTYFVLLIASFIALSFLVPAMNSLHYISLLFVIIAITLLCFIPFVFPKYISFDSWLKPKLYFVLTLYSVLCAGISYIFAFVLNINSSFYFLAHTIGLAVILFILTGIIATSNEYKHYEEEEEVNENTNQEIAR